MVRGPPDLPSISGRALATAQGRWILIGASESLAKQGSPASGHRLFFFGKVFFGGPSWRFFFRLQLGSFWASCGSLGASQNPSALCIKSGWAGALVALKIRSEYLKKEALLLLGGPGGPRGALRKPKKFRLGSLAASSGRRTDPLHIHSGSWPPGPQTLSFFRVLGTRQNHSQNRGRQRLGPPRAINGFGLGAFFCAKGVSGHFLGVSIEGLLGLLRLPGRESESIGPVHQIWLGGGLGGPETAPLGLAKNSAKTVLG